MKRKTRQEAQLLAVRQRGMGNDELGWKLITGNGNAFSESGQIEQDRLKSEDIRNELKISQ
jgi:hypothetical protein